MVIPSESITLLSKVFLGLTSPVKSEELLVGHSSTNGRRSQRETFCDPRKEDGKYAWAQLGCALLHFPSVESHAFLPCALLRRPFVCLRGAWGCKTGTGFISALCWPVPIPGLAAWFPRLQLWAGNRSVTVLPQQRSEGLNGGLHLYTCVY